jgi:hypothetical protein
MYLLVLNEFDDSFTNTKTPRRSRGIVNDNCELFLRFVEHSPII